MTVFGGTANLVGPVLGAGILGLLPEVFHELKDYLLAFNGFILIVVILYLPNGIWDPRRMRAFWRRRKAVAVARAG
jgi:branched-chain amino acid transport system permease protein